MPKIQNFKMFINGEWVESSSRKKIESLNGLEKLIDIINEIKILRNVNLTDFCTVE